MSHQSANSSWGGATALSDEAPTQITVEADAAIVRQKPDVVIAAFVAVVAVFVAIFKFPPILDYPNHYARMWLLAGGIDMPPFQQIYAIDWNRTFTNVGIDLMAYWLGPLIGVSLLARGLLFLAIALPPLGAIALHRRLFGGGYYWQIAILYFAWCATLIGGFINFQIGLGMALFFATADHALQSRNRVALFVWRLLAGLLLTTMHIFSLGFYMALVCGLEFSPTTAAMKSFRDFMRLCGRLAVAMLACALPAICLFLYQPVLPGDGDGNLDASWNNSPLLILANLMSAFWSYTLLVDTLFLIPLILVCTFAVRTRRLRLHAGLVVTAVGLLILACVSPRHLLATGWIGWRFPIMAALAAMVMICPLPRLSRRQACLSSPCLPRLRSAGLPGSASTGGRARPRSPTFAPCLPRCRKARRSYQSCGSRGANRMSSIIVTSPGIRIRSGICRRSPSPMRIASCRRFLPPRASSH